MAQFIYTMNRVGKVVPPKRVILRDISLSFFPGAKIGVLGLNGSGKSTLLKIMAGIDQDIEGEARAQPGIKIGYLPQEPELDDTKTVREVVGEGVGDVQGLIDRFNAVSDRFAEPMSDDDMNKLLEEQAKLQDKIDAVGGWELERKLEIAADSLRLPPWDALIGKLSGGEKRRVALCRLLLSKPDMLLLDEPTNHLDAESVAWLERFLGEYPSTVIAVTHDRYFLDNVAEWILELDRGHGIPWHGNYSSWLEQKEQRLAHEERQQEALSKSLQRELEWVRQNPKARQAKSKARLQRYEELASQEFQKRNETNEIYIPPGDRLGDLVIECKDLRKGFGDRLLIDGLNFSLPAGGIVGIIGPNGAGKTTLFRMLTGGEKPDAGEIRVGPTVKLAYVDQSRQSLTDSNTVWREISGGLDLIKVGNYETSSRGYVGRFNFRGVQQQQLIGDLSGGERNRVHLAKVLKEGGNVLLLDEPTNDLDIETLRALEEALLAFPGCAVVISHDRWFLDRIATHILAFEGDSQVVWFEGNYQEYEEDLKRRKGEDAAQPHRIRYKPLQA
ncbi:MAG: energy-dependent translational throttle protein EttA [Gammaproteobacteria bacterium]|nr:energy-dependent translational throttle protein EttA [Gammaproteobacteria bacterium]MDE2349117.1 energy-dependent translational throttle protein EttA [Gammaproteobacteria bacterium]